MPLTLTDIVNGAFVKLGVPSVQSIDDDIASARSAKLRWPAVRSHLLRLHLWKFAKSEPVILAPLATPPANAEFSYQFNLPTDCIRLCDISEESFMVEGRTILADSDSIVVRYIRDLEDTSKYDACFTELASAYLAAELSIQLTKELSLKDSLQRDVMALLKQAKSIDSTESEPKTIDASEWLDARRIGPTEGGTTGLSTAFSSSSSAALAECTCPVFSETVDGLVPAPGADPGYDRVLYADGTWRAVAGGSGSGDVTGPSSATDGAIVLFNGTTGKIIKTSGVQLSSLAPLNSPTFTNTPAAPTAAADTNTTQLATTAFVQQEISNDTTKAAASHTHNASDISAGTLPVARGGTGVATATAYAPLFGGTTGTGAFQSGTVGTAGQVLTSNGAGSLPTFQAAAGGSSPTTTQGDLIARGASADQRLAIGPFGSILASDGTDPGYIHPSTHYRFYDDFDGTSLNPYSLGWQGSGTGGTTVLANAEAGAPGIFQIGTSTGATNSRFMQRGLVGLLAGGGRFVCSWRVRIPVLSDGTETFTLRIGLHDSTPVDGLWFEYIHSTNSGQWQIKASSNSTATTTNTSSAPSANTWYVLTIDCNAAGSSVDYYIDGANVGTIATANIPTGSGRVFGPNAGIIKSAGTTARVLDLDYFWILQKLTTAR